MNFKSATVHLGSCVLKAVIDNLTHMSIKESRSEFSEICLSKTDHIQYTY